VRKFIFSTLAVFACSPSPSTTDAGDAGMPMGAAVIILADTNRNGTIDWNDPTELANHDTWDVKHGAIFLANIDDDQVMCPKKDANGATLSDIELPKCNDAADTVVNGDIDLLDMAPLETKPWPDAPMSATGKLTVSDPASGMVHLFKKQSDGSYAIFDPTMDSLSLDDLKAGAKFLIEGIDIVRDRDVWDGNLTITYAVGDKSDKVAMRIAPVLSRHHLDKENRVFYAKLIGDPGSAVFENTLKTGVSSILPSAPPDFYDPLSANDIQGDQWSQDYFELGYMSMPIVGGKQHVIDVYYRSANVYSMNAKNPLRPAGKVVFLKFRGVDAAGVQQFDPKHDQNSDSLNSFGNLETIPPYDKYPLGRLYRGNIKTFGPDPTFEKMVESQAVQPPVYIDTSWLLVGHVDETTSFIKVQSPRGWALLVNDARMAKKMQQDQQAASHGAAVMFEGLKWSDGTTAQTTIDQVLANMDVMTESASSAAAVDSQLAILQKETGLTDSEIIHVPFLHESVMGASLAYQPGTVNGLSFANNGFAAPEPHGPVINGKDIFKTQLEGALSSVGVTVVWVEDWDLYHALAGEVHCASNSRRDVPDTETWWTSGY